MNIIIQETISRINNILSIIRTVTESKKKVVFLILGITYRISLDIYYMTVVSPTFAYEGLHLAPNTIKYILSWIIYLSIYQMIPKDEISVSSFFLNLQFAITFAPMTSFYSLNNQSTLYMLFVSISIYAQILILKPSKSKKMVGFSLFNLEHYISTFMIILIPSLIILAFLWGGFYGFQSFNLEFLGIMRKYANFPTILSYAFWWLLFGIIPFYLGLNLVKKRYLIAVFLIIVDILLYMIFGFKIIYLSIFVMLVVFTVSKFRVLINGIYFGMSSLCIMSTILFFLEKHAINKKLSVLITAFLGDRFIFGPALNKFLYYDFFSQYPKVYFADGQIGKALGLTYPYNGSIGQVVFAFMNKGRLYESNSNTGYLGDSYAQFGFIGLLVLSIFLAYIIKFINEIKLNFTIIATALGVQIVILNDGALFTTLLTNGFIILIVLCLIYSKQEEKIYFRRNLNDYHI